MEQAAGLNIIMENARRARDIALGKRNQPGSCFGILYASVMKELREGKEDESSVLKALREKKGMEGKNVKKCSSAKKVLAAVLIGKYAF